MMTIGRTKQLIPFLMFFSLACGLFAPVSAPAPALSPVVETATAEAPMAVETKSTPSSDISTTQTTSTEQVEKVIIATPTASATPKVDPADLVEKLIPPPALSPGGSYRLENEILKGAYGIRYWHHTDSQTGFEDVILIEKTGMESIKIEAASEIVTLIDADINGDGNPDMIVQTYTGGAHCCFGTQVYSLGETPKLILDKPESNASGRFEDLDGDNIYEFITADDAFAYQYCPFVSSPAVKVIMAYDAQEEVYLSASPNFPDEYEEDLEAHTKNATRVSRANISENGEWDETTKCSILPLTLDYIYLGELETARAELDSFYAYDDIDRFWNEIMLIVQDSPLYIAKEK